MIGLLIKQLYRSRGLVIGLLILFAVGLLSIHAGKVFIDRQEQIIELTDQAQTEHIERHVEYIDGHIGLLLYYIKFGFANERTPIAGLSIGQRDIRQAAQLINIRNLEEQKNTAEFLNPFFQLLGNLDLSFVLIYLFPLFIITLCFDLWSEERESGRWALLVVQSNNPRGIILSKLLLRLTMVILLLCLLLFIAILYLNIPLDFSLLSFVGLSILYICFWFSLSWWVASLSKSSKQNAIILLSSWLLLTTVLPVLGNTMVSTLYPIPEAYETTIDSRDGYHTKWDLPKAPTIEKFKAHYPQYEEYSHSEGKNFSWFWYYAMQQMGDDESLEARQAMKEKLRKRNDLTKWIGYFVPSIHTQLNMNALGKTDMTNYLNYMEALEAHHENLRLSFYKKIFEAKPIDTENWGNYKLEYFTEKRNLNPLNFIPLLMASFIFLVLAYFSLKRNLVD